MSTAITQAQINTYKDISSLVELSGTDSIANIERLAAVKFHGLINNYRLSKGRKILIWDDTLWIACRNHNNYMLERDDLDHNESRMNTYFTGKQPHERYDFVSEGRSTFEYAGENILYNNSFIGNNRHEIARNMAELSFEQWRTSPGHNRNMLARNYRHGVAFLIDGSKVWATNLFSKSERPPLPSDRMFVKNGLTLPMAKMILAEELPAKLYADLGFQAKQVSRRKNRSSKNAKNLLSKTRRKNDRNGDVIYSKVTYDKSSTMFSLFSKQYTCYELVLEKNFHEFHMDSIITEMLGYLKKEQSFSSKDKIDLSVAMKKKSKNILIITMSCFVYEKKNRIIPKF